MRRLQRKFRAFERHNRKRKLHGMTTLKLREWERLMIATHALEVTRYTLLTEAELS